LAGSSLFILRFISSEEDVTKVILAVGYLWITFVTVYVAIEWYSASSPLGWYIYGHIVVYSFSIVLFTYVIFCLEEHYD